MEINRRQAIASCKGILSNFLHCGRQCYLGQLNASVKRLIANSRNSLREFHALQNFPGIIFHRLLTVITGCLIILPISHNACSARRIFDLLNMVTSIEYAASYTVIHRNGHRLQSGTIGKGTASPGCYRIRNFNFCKTCTAAECISPYGLQPGWQGNIRKIFTIVKRCGFNLTHLIGQGNTGQFTASIKRI